MAHEDQRLYLPALATLRADVGRRRAEAFCDAPDFICGVEVKPMTPATFSMLLAIGSPFLIGGQPQEVDVRNYLWFHSPSYAHCGVKDWASRKRRALRPFVWQLTQPWLRWIGRKPSLERYCATLALVVVDIRRQVENAFADAGRGGGNGAPLATLEASLTHEFALAYQWPAERTRHMPLAQLFQLHRCIRRSRGEDVPDPSEESLLFAHLHARNEELRKQREAAAEPEEQKT